MKKTKRVLKMALSKRQIIAMVKRGDEFYDPDSNSYEPSPPTTHRKENRQANAEEMRQRNESVTLFLLGELSDSSAQAADGCEKTKDKALLARSGDERT